MPQIAAILVKVCRLFDECESDEQQRMVRWLVSEYGFGDPGMPWASASAPMSNAERQAAYRERLRNASVTDSVTDSVTENVTATVTEERNAPHNVAPVVALNGSHNRQVNEDAKEALQFLNTQTGRSYRPVEANLKLIRNCIKNGATLANCKGVIARKSREWKGTEMEKYLRPATLFNSVKFEQYLGERSAE